MYGDKYVSGSKGRFNIIRLVKNECHCNNCFHRILCYCYCQANDAVTDAMTLRYVFHWLLGAMLSISHQLMKSMEERRDRTRPWFTDTANIASIEAAGINIGMSYADWLTLRQEVSNAAGYCYGSMRRQWLNYWWHDWQSACQLMLALPILWRRSEMVVETPKKVANSLANSQRMLNHLYLLIIMQESEVSIV